MSRCSKSNFASQDVVQVNHLFNAGTGIPTSEAAASGTGIREANNDLQFQAAQQS